MLFDPKLHQKNKSKSINMLNGVQLIFFEVLNHRILRSLQIYNYVEQSATDIFRDFLYDCDPHWFFSKLLYFWRIITLTINTRKSNETIGTQSIVIHLDHHAQWRSQWRSTWVSWPVWIFEFFEENLDCIYTWIVEIRRIPEKLLKFFLIPKHPYTTTAPVSSTCIYRVRVNI